MRCEFPKPTKREALRRAQNRCEAMGEMYGLPTGVRCAADLGYGVQFDHVILDANSKDNSLENCAAVCVRCHKHKTRTHDIPKAAKTLRQQDKDTGVAKRRSTFACARTSKWKAKIGGGVVLR